MHFKLYLILGICTSNYMHFIIHCNYHIWTSGYTLFMLYVVLSPQFEVWHFTNNFNGFVFLSLQEDSNLTCTEFEYKEELEVWHSNHKNVISLQLNTIHSFYIVFKWFYIFSNAFPLIKLSVPLRKSSITQLT